MTISFNDQITTWCNADSSSISWGFIHGLFESAVYGGRIDNQYDNRVLASYLAQIFNSNPSKALGPLHLPSTHVYKVRIRF